MVAGIPPIRAMKARYYEDARFRERLLTPPELKQTDETRPDDWTALPIPVRPESLEDTPDPPVDDEDPTESERRLQPELRRAKPVEKKKPIENEWEAGLSDDADEAAVQNRRMVRHVQTVARQVSMNPHEGMDL